MCLRVVVVVVVVAAGDERGCFWRWPQVAELWHGPERHCAHRCLQRGGACGYTLAVARREGLYLQPAASIYEV
jgi:hypothetical protein